MPGTVTPGSGFIARPPKAAALTDPMLTALLMYIDNAAGDDDNGSVAKKYAAAADAADAMLTSYPLTTAFGGILNRPNVADFVRAAVDANRSTSEQDDDHRQLHHRVTDGADDVEPITGERGQWQSLLWAYSDEAVLIGATLMYRLLKGGTR